MFASALAISILVSQIPCAPSDGSALCQCKQGVASACAALTDRESETLKDLLRASAMAHAAKESGKAKEHAGDVVDTGCGSGQDPKDDDSKCEGQSHHIISMAVWKALELHLVLKDLKAHCGYQKWHQQLDAEIRGWLKAHDAATAQEFEAYLRQLYARPDLLARFPNGF